MNADLRPLAGESFVEIPRRRSTEMIPGLWKPPAPGRPVGLVFHGAFARTFHEVTRSVTGTLGALGYGTLRILFRPLEWMETPSKNEVLTRRVPLACDAVRWIRRECPGSPLILAGGSMGAVVAGRIAAGSRAAGLVLISPAVRNRTRGDTFDRWPLKLRQFHKPKLVIVGDRDDEWAPVDLVQAAIRSWPPPVDLEVIRGATHGMKGADEPLRDAILRWERIHLTPLESRA